MTARPDERAPGGAPRRVSSIRCSFCGKSKDHVKGLVSSQTSVYICNECVDLCVKIFAENDAGCTDDCSTTTPTPIDCHDNVSTSAAPEASRPVDGVPRLPPMDEIVRLYEVKPAGKSGEDALAHSAAASRALAEIYVDAVESENARLRASLATLTQERDAARDRCGDANECIEMAQEVLAKLVFISGLDKGQAAMFLPEAICNACILVRDEALAHAEDAHRADLTAARTALESREAELREAMGVIFTLHRQPCGCN